MKNSSTDTRDEFYRLGCVLMRLFIAVASSVAVAAICRRVSLLSESAWLPGLADSKAIAALTNKSDRTIEDWSGDNPRTKHHFGRQVYYRLSDLATNPKGKATRGEA
jgi:hypothetical protein